MRSTLLAAALAGAALRAGEPAALPPAPVDEYRIHADGGLVYDPLRREAEKTGALARFAGAPASDSTLESGPFTLAVKVPAAARAYDVVPIAYELAWKDSGGGLAAEFPVAVESVAFEDESRRCGRDLFDLALPGRVDLAVELLGSITAHFNPGARHIMAPDFSDTPGTYPPFARKPFVRSGVIEAGDLVWFKLRFTNTGTTILDPEGLGGSLFYPQLLRKNERGEYAVAGEPYNLYFRDLEYLYPGESHEMWFHLASCMPGYASPAGAPTPQGFGLVPGEYKLRFRLICRCYRTPDPFLNIWEGEVVHVCDLPFAVEREARDAPVAPIEAVRSDGAAGRNITRFIHTFEEFMTAFDCHLAPPEGAGGRIAGTLHLQVAPWTKHVVIKLIRGGGGQIATRAVPIAIDCGALAVRPSLDPRTCLVRNGVREPIIASQAMADMRTNVQIGPFPEVHIRARLREMASCGINAVSTTCMPWLYDDMPASRSNYQGDALKYVLDVARDEGMRVEGIGTYPFDRATSGPIATWLTGTSFTPANAGAGYGAISRADPLLPAVNAALWRYQFARWGDLYLEAEDGAVPISVEDSWGWMRQDVNVRHPMGALTVQAFRAWLKAKYGAIEDVNAAWGSAFEDFDRIEPEAGQVKNRFGHIFEYTDPAHPFHDWNRAVADLDAFRTALRVKNYRETLDLVRKDIPGAVVCLRTEGANVLAAGLDPAGPNSHFRHAYLSQRRCAAVAEIVQASGLVRYHADYTTLPYTPTELRFLVRSAAGQGIVPVFLPQFDNMRDIAINAAYGTEYQVHYNLPEPRKGYMMHCLTALFPWFRAVAEEGGIPGILWEDYQCDGFATETQKREMRLFAAKVKEAFAAPAAREKLAAPVAARSDEWRRGAKAMRSFRRVPDYEFRGRMSREVLESYLARAITYSELLHGIGNVDDNLRMLANAGAKLVGRAIYRWGGESALEKLLEAAAPIAAKAHRADPDIILQAAAFEIVTTQVGEVKVPERVFREFGLVPEARAFRYEDMLYADGRFVDHWRKGSSVPDMSRPETRMWFFHLASSYIDIGVEAVHFGQVELMDKQDPGRRHWRDLLARVRRYASSHARRGMLLCDAHVPSGGIVEDGALLFDFHSFPLRIDEVPERPGHGVLKMGYLDSIFGRSAGGVTPSGWRCEHLPFLVELDNFGRSGRGGQNIGAHWIWGYDEISWFAHQSEEYRNEWLRYAWKWVREHDPNGYLQMPGSRTLADPAGGKRWYWANTRSEACPDGFNQEETIKAIWAEPPAAAGASADARARQEDAWPEKDWPRATAEEAGLDAALLASARDYALTGGGAGIVTRGGRLVLAWGDVREKYDLKSTTKSFGCIALGLAVKDGLVKLETQARSLHPALGVPPEVNARTGRLDRITILHLASQTAGFEKPGGYTPLLFEPGTKWDYSDSGPNWLAECLTLAWKRDLDEVMFERVFSPLGITRADLSWRKNSYRPAQIEGVARREFGAGIHACADAMARIGLLMLREGRWKEREILPRDFVRQASRVPAGHEALEVLHPETYGRASRHYGLLWWNNADGTLQDVPRDAYWSWGLYDSLIVVVPSLDIVAARAGKSWTRAEGADHYDVLKPFLGPLARAAGARRSAGAGAPCPPSPVIAGIEWAPRERIERYAKGSDNWPVAWADDDALYAAYGDGRGFEPFVEEKLSLGLAKIEGAPGNVRGVNLRSPSAEALGDGARGRKASGLLCVGGVLYLWVRNAANSQLGWSSDHGATWTWADWKFTESFGCPSFLSFGRDYAGARDEFVYVYSHDAGSAYVRADSMVLARAPKERLRERAAYEFLARLDERGGAEWTRDIAGRGAVFTHPGACYRSSVSFNAGLRRYLWCQTGRGEDTRVAGGFAIYDAPEPWGPWTAVFSTDNWDVGPGESMHLPPKWMSAGGLTVHLVFSGDDCFSVRRGTLRLRAATP